jgi:hypothetical protein
LRALAVRQPATRSQGSARHGRGWGAIRCGESDFRPACNRPVECLGAHLSGVHHRHTPGGGSG